MVRGSETQMARNLVGGDLWRLATPPPRSPARTVVTFVSLSLLIISVGILDRVTGLAPDLTILYLLPLLAAVYLLGLRAGILEACVALAADAAANATFVAAPVLATDAMLHFLVFILSVIGTDRLLEELRAVLALQQARNIDLDIARDMHRQLIGSPPAEHEGLEIAARLVYAREIGGDYYRFGTMGDAMFFCVGDISGKGVAAALFTALLDQAVINALDQAATLADVPRHVNARVHDAFPSSMFVTLFFAVISDDAISWVNAGHEPPLLYLASEARLATLSTAEGLPLGVAAEFTGAERRRALGKGDILLAVTDGVTESPALGAEPRERIRELFLSMAAAGTDAHGIAEAVRVAAIGARGDAPRDDVAIVCVRKCPSSPPEGS